MSLLLDEMSLRRQIVYDSKTSSYTGYVNIGEGVSSEDPKPATDALVFMVVGVNWPFKIPIAYFFIAGNCLCPDGDSLRGLRDCISDLSSAI